MRTSSIRPLATTLVLVGAMTLFAGCGDEGAHLPAGMSGSSASYTGGATGIDAVDSVLGEDPGPATAGIGSAGVDDPVLAGYDGVDSVDGSSLDDAYARAANDWTENEGSGSTALLDDPYGDDLMPVGYGRGYGDDYGYGDGIFGTALSAAGYGGAGLMDAGLYGGDDLGMMDAGIDDVDMFDDTGFDAGFVDTGFDAGGFDAGAMDIGFEDPGFDAGIADVGMDVGMDAGFVDPGFDAGIDVGGFDAGVVDVGGFDAGIGF